MAFRSTQGTQPPLSVTFNQLTQQAGVIKTSAVTMRDRLAVASVDGLTVLHFIDRLVDLLGLMNAATTLGAAMLQYAKDQHNDPTYDIVVEKNAVEAAITAILNWVDTNYPKSAGGYLEVSRMVGNRRVLRQFAPAQTTTLRTLIDGLIASID